MGSCSSKSNVVPSVFENHFFKRDPQQHSDEAVDGDAEVQDSLQMLSLYKAQAQRSIRRELIEDLTAEMVNQFGSRATITSKHVDEILPLVRLQKSEITFAIWSALVAKIQKEPFLEAHLLMGLEKVIRHSEKSYFIDEQDKLVAILQILFEKLIAMHSQQENKLKLKQVIFALTSILDAMRDAGVKGLERESLHQPTYDALHPLIDDDDSELSYQAQYAVQALVRVASNEDRFHFQFRKLQEAVNVAQALKGLVLGFNVSGLVELYEGLTILSKFNDLPKAWYEEIRMCQFLTRHNRLMAFETFLYSSAGHQKEAVFQWHLLKLVDQLVVAEPSESVVAGCFELFSDVLINDHFWDSTEMIKHFVLDKIKSYMSNPELRGFAMSALYDIKTRAENEALKRSIVRYDPEVLASTPEGFATNGIVDGCKACDWAPICAVEII